ncbi:MAG: condensation domain-containing protein [Methylotetracoccus sp.]
MVLRAGGGRSHWNQSVLLTLGATVDAAHLEQALIAVVAQHDALRLRFSLHGTETGGGKTMARRATCGLEREDLSELPAASRRGVLEAGRSLATRLEHRTGSVIARCGSTWVTHDACCW